MVQAINQDELPAEELAPNDEVFGEQRASMWRKARRARSRSRKSHQGGDFAPVSAKRTGGTNQKSPLVDERRMEFIQM